MLTTYETPIIKNLTNNLIDMLKVTSVEVIFIKTDGTERKMKCTLKEDIIKPYEKKTDKIKPHKEGVLSVWDLDKEGWRSFRIDNIISYSYINDRGY